MGKSAEFCGPQNASCVNFELLVGRASRSGDRLRCGLRWPGAGRSDAGCAAAGVAGRARCQLLLGLAQVAVVDQGARGGQKLVGEVFFGQLQSPEGAVLCCCRAQALEAAGLAAHGAVGYGEGLENQIGAALTCERVQVVIVQQP